MHEVAWLFWRTRPHFPWIAQSMTLSNRDLIPHYERFLQRKGVSERHFEFYQHVYHELGVFLGELIVESDVGAFDEFLAAKIDAGLSLGKQKAYRQVLEDILEFQDAYQRSRRRRSGTPTPSVVVGSAAEMAQEAQMGLYTSAELDEDCSQDLPGASTAAINAAPLLAMASASSAARSQRAAKSFVSVHTKRTADPTSQPPVGMGAVRGDESGVPRAARDGRGADFQHAMTLPVGSGEDRSGVGSGGGLGHLLDHHAYEEEEGGGEPGLLLSRDGHREEAPAKKSPMRASTLNPADLFEDALAAVDRHAGDGGVRQTMMGRPVGARELSDVGIAAAVAAPGSAAAAERTPPGGASAEPHSAGMPGLRPAGGMPGLPPPGGMPGLPSVSGALGGHPDDDVDLGAPEPAARGGALDGIPRLGSGAGGVGSGPVSPIPGLPLPPSQSSAAAAPPLALGLPPSLTGGAPRMMPSPEASMGGGGEEGGALPEAGEVAFSKLGMLSGSPSGGAISVADDDDSERGQGRQKKRPLLRHVDGLGAKVGGTQRRVRADGDRSEEELRKIQKRIERRIEMAESDAPSRRDGFRTYLFEDRFSIDQAPPQPEAFSVLVNRHSPPWFLALRASTWLWLPGLLFLLLAAVGMTSAMGMLVGVEMPVPLAYALAGVGGLLAALLLGPAIRIVVRSNETLARHTPQAALVAYYTCVWQGNYPGAYGMLAKPEQAPRRAPTFDPQTEQVIGGDFNHLPFKYFVQYWSAHDPGRHLKGFKRWRSRLMSPEIGESRLVTGGVENGGVLMLVEDAAQGTYRLIPLVRLGDWWYVADGQFFPRTCTGQREVIAE